MAEDDSFISVPKKKAGIFIPLAALTVASTMFGAFRGLMDYLDQVAQRAVAEKQRQQRIEERLDRLERYKCVLGWNPPETKNPDRVCEED
jgi:hypothetical protein